MTQIQVRGETLTLQPLTLGTVLAEHAALARLAETASLDGGQLSAAPGVVIAELPALMRVCGACVGRDEAWLASLNLAEAVQLAATVLSSNLQQLIELLPRPAPSPPPADAVIKPPAYAMPAAATPPQH